MATVSFWEREELLRCDVIIIGAGIIGLSAALRVKELEPNAHVVVLEREILPTGASTKNAGFSCFGSLTEMLHDISEVGESAAIAVVEQRKRGIDLLQSRVGVHNMGYEACGGNELIFLESLHAIDSISYVNSLLEPLFGKEYFVNNPKLVQEYQFGERVQSVIYTKHEGSINTGITLRNLLQLVTSKGIRIHTGAEVANIESTAHGVSVSVQRSVLNSTLEFKAKQVIVCTNALAPMLTGNTATKPGRGQVLITNPIEKIPFKGVFHFTEGYYYFRNVGNRVLFGGGRNTAFEEETTDTFALTESLQQHLVHLLSTVILPTTPYTIDMQWAGIMGFNTSKLPSIQTIRSGITTAFGCNGMGVAIGSLIGNQAAETALGKTSDAV